MFDEGPLKLLDLRAAARLLMPRWSTGDVGKGHVVGKHITAYINGDLSGTDRH